jgi:hypothetical protein
MRPDGTNDRDSRKQRVQLRSLERISDQLRFTLQLPGADLEARPHLERALAHVREASLAVGKVDHARTVAHLIKDLETGENLTQKIGQLCADQNRGAGITP